MNDQNGAVMQAAARYGDALGNCGGALIADKAAADGGSIRIALYEAPPYELRVSALPMWRLSINLRDAPVVGKIADEPTQQF